jgi:polyhydroxybutyrate depolymerase
MKNYTLNRVSLASLLLASACSVETEPPTGTGGSGAGTGGTTTAGTGGSGANAGAAATSGAGTGGVTSVGGSSTGGKASGGTSGSSMGGSGGNATGGSSGATTGGGAGQSGAGAANAGTGGASGAGAGGKAGGGAGSGGGTNAGAGGAAMSEGCGATTWPESDRYTIDVDGSSREYILDVPEDYDSSRPYRLIFGWHWRGGQASDVSGGALGGGAYYGLKNRAEGSTIFVSPEGIDNGWANSGGSDIDFLDAMLARFDSELCIDKTRIFSTGFSYGGMMSIAVGCAKGGVFRAIAPISGAPYSGCVDGDQPVAFLGIHGDADNVVPLSNGEQGRDEFLARNNCDTQTMATEPSGCVSYQGCDAGYPVHWCEFSGGHSPPNFSSAAIWDFFSQF